MSTRSPVSAALVSAAVLCCANAFADTNPRWYEPCGYRWTILAETSEQARVAVGDYDLADYQDETGPRVVAWRARVATFWAPDESSDGANAARDAGEAVP